MADIFEEIRRRAIKPGGTYLLKPGDAEYVLEHFWTEDVRLLGIDALVVTDRKTQPRMDLSLDFSCESTHGREAVERALELIRENCQMPDLHFELVLDELDR